MRGFFSKIHLENLVRFLEVKLIKVWVPAKVPPPWIFCQAIHAEPPANHQTVWIIPNDTGSCCGLLLPVSCDYPPFGFSNFGDSRLPWDLNSLMNLRRVVDFQFVWLLPCCEDGSENSETLHVSDQELKSPVRVFTYCIKKIWLLF